MSESTLFKDNYNEALAQRMAARITAVHPVFNGESFVSQIVPLLPGKELKERVLVFTHALHDYLPPSYPAAWAILQATLEAELTATTGVFEDGWLHWPMAQFIELYGFR